MTISGSGLLCWWPVVWALPLLTAANSNADDCRLIVPAEGSTPRSRCCLARRAAEAAEFVPNSKAELCLRIAALVSTFEGIVAVTPFSAKDVSKAGC